MLMRLNVSTLKLLLAHIRNDFVTILQDEYDYSSIINIIILTALIVIILAEIFKL